MYINSYPLTHDDRKEFGEFLISIAKRLNEETLSYKTKKTGSLQILL